MKQRIMSRKRLFEILNAELSPVQKEREKFTHEQKQQAHFDMMCYMLCDNDEIKIYHCREMGGMVVEVK